MANPIIILCRVNASGASGIGVRASDNGTLLLSDIAGSSSSLKIESGKILSVYAAQYETVAGMGTLQPLKGDRSAWDVDSYPILHASDIDAGLPVYHVGPGGIVGQAPVWDGDEWVPTDVATQAELDAVKDESFVVMAATADLANERMLTAGTAIGVADGGAGGAATINHAQVATGDLHTEYIQESLLDAKGDLIVASADNTPGRLPVGLDGQLLTPDATQSLGVKWIDPSSVVSPGGAQLHGLARWNGAVAQTNFELVDVAEYVDWVADNGLMFDPGEDYSLDADGDTIVLTSGLAEAAVITAGYVIAQI